MGVDVIKPVSPLKMYQCRYCNYQRDINHPVKRHVETKHPGMAVDVIKPVALLKMYQCGYCNYQSDRTYGVKRHSEIKHPGMNFTIVEWKLLINFPKPI